MASILLFLAATLGIALLGAAQAERGARVLGVLDPFFQFLTSSGQALIRTALAHAFWIGCALTIACGFVAYTCVQQAQRRAAPMVCMALAVSLLAWGEILLLADAIPQGICLYAAGFVAALIWGILAPLPAFARFTRSDASARQGSAPNTQGEAAPTATDTAIVLALLGLCLITRTYALTELPHEYEAEMIFSMLSSRTLLGLKHYVPEGIVSNTNGVVHLLPQWALFSLLGTSAFALRFVSVVCGLVCTVLFYRLMRRIGGRSVAAVATLFFVTSPDQLFWSRQENTPFQFVTLLVLILATAGLRMAAQPNWKTVLVASLCMPLARLGYGPAMVMAFFPPLVYGHALLTGRVGWRTLTYALPMLATGALLWVISLSTVSSLVSGEPWRFINPTLSAGAPVWQGEGTFRNATLPQLVQLQANNLAKNAASVAKAMTYRSGFTTWYRRADESAHPTMTNVVVTVLLALAVAYSLAQLREPRAFALLVWISLEMLPALLSVDPVPRRMVGAFPGFYAIIALTLGAVATQSRVYASPAVALLVRRSLAAVVALVSFSAMASYFLLPIRETVLGTLFRGTKRAFVETDAVLHNLGGDWALLLAFGHSNELFGHGKVPCYEATRSRDWLKAVLSMTCPFESAATRHSRTEQQLEELRRSYDPKRIHLLLEDRLATKRDIATVKELFPQVRLQHLPTTPGSSLTLVWMQLDRQDVDALRTLTLHPSASTNVTVEEAKAILRDYPVELGAPGEHAGVLMEGSLIIDREGWFQLGLATACPAATITVDGQTATEPHWVPLTNGAHELKLSMPSASACPLPLKITAARWINREASSAFAPTLAAAKIAIGAGLRGRHVIRSSGYEETPIPDLPAGTLLDFAVDESDTLLLLQKDESQVRIVRVNAEGVEEARWRLPLEPLGLSRAPDGTLFVPYPNDTVELYSPKGQLLARWNSSLVRSATIGHLADGSILSALPGGAIVVLDRNGKELQTWMEFEGGPGAFFEPWSVGANRNGDILVLQSDGAVLLFQTPVDGFAPRFEREFFLDFLEPSTLTRGWAFDETRGRVVVPDQSGGSCFSFNLQGESVMASDPTRDLSAQDLGVARRVGVTATAVYVLDGSQHLRRFRSLDP